MGFSWQCGSGLLLGLIGVAALVLGMLFPAAIDQVLTKGIKDAVIIKESDMTENNDKYQAFASNDAEDAVPVYVNVYLWNCTNAHDVVSTSATPTMDEVGPYVYRKYSARQSVSWTTSEDGQKVVKYKTRTRYVFQAEKSSGVETDLIYAANLMYRGLMHKLPLLAAAASLTEAQFWTATTTALGLSTGVQRAFAHKTALQIIFGQIAGSTVLTAGILGQGGQKDTTTTTWDWLYTGEDAMHLTHYYYQVEDVKYNKNELGAFAYATPAASRIYGFDGTQFPAFQDKGLTFPVYVDNAQRAFPITNIDEEEVEVEGIKMLKYSLPSTALANAATVASNADYYAFGSSGFINLTVANNVPMFLSKPHFLDVSPAYTGVSGHSSDRTKHDLWLGVEPNTGLVMTAYKRLQVNVFTESYNIGGSADFTMNSAFIPLMWIEETATITSDKAATFKNSIYFAQNLSKTLSLAFFIGGIVAGVIGLLLLTSAALSSGPNTVQVAPAK